jgi:Cu-Zn family superoxide dismutase
MAAKAADPGAKAQLVNLDGKVIGEADFFQTPHGVLIEVAAKGLPPGPHAVHVHAVGTCSAQDKFASAGPHFSPDPKSAHGYMSVTSHAGDMPNQVAAADGSLRASMLNDTISLGDGANSLFDSDGAAIVIHAKADDYASQPSGNAGDRLVCGVIKKS